MEISEAQDSARAAELWWLKKLREMKENEFRVPKVIGAGLIVVRHVRKLMEPPSRPDWLLWLPRRKPRLSVKLIINTGPQYEGELSYIFALCQAVGFDVEWPKDKLHMQITPESVVVNGHVIWSSNGRGGPAEPS